MRRAFALVVLLFLTCGAAAVRAQDPAAPQGAAAAPAAAAKAPLRHEVRLEAMIGQMLIIGFPGTDPDAAWPRHVSDLIRRGQIGGVILFGGNVASRDQLARLTSRLARAASALPPFIAVDQEGGAVQRLDFLPLPSARQVARGQDLHSAYLLYDRMAAELRTHGINVNFGPVVDLDAGAASPVIGRLGRSFGADPGTVTEYARMFILAHRRAGILTSAKHFPGHGSSRVDTHHDLGDVSGSWTAAELKPFHELIRDKLPDMIMVGHLYHPEFSDGHSVPAVLSKRAIRYLRGTLRWDGLVITDDLQMGAIRKRYSLEESAVQAVVAGNDILLISNATDPDPQVAARVTRAIVDAVDKGRIDAKAVEASYGRIVKAKTFLRASARDLADEKSRAANADR